MMSFQKILWLESMIEDEYCPFAKAIWGGCCDCEHAEKVDQRTRGVKCGEVDRLRDHCLELDDMFKNTAYNLKDEQIGEILTYSQLMKVRCGGFSGMQRLLDSEDPSISTLVEGMRGRYQQVKDFPFDVLIEDMNNFHLRKKRRK